MIPGMSLTNDELIRMYRALVGTRKAEEAITDLNKQGVLRARKVLI